MPMPVQFLKKYIDEEAALIPTIFEASNQLLAGDTVPAVFGFACMLR